MVKFPRGGTAAFLLAAVLIIAGCSQPSRDLVADPSVASAAPSMTRLKKVPQVCSLKFPTRGRFLL